MTDLLTEARAEIDKLRQQLVDCTRKKDVFENLCRYILGRMERNQFGATLSLYTSEAIELQHQIEAALAGEGE